MSARRLLCLALVGLVLPANAMAADSGDGFDPEDAYTQIWEDETGTDAAGNPIEQTEPAPEPAPVEATPAPDPKPKHRKRRKGGSGGWDWGGWGNEALPVADGLKLKRNGRVAFTAAVPKSVRQVIYAANKIAKTPYRYGGGHGTFSDNAYDCSGSVSFALHGAGLLNTTLVSGQLASWGAKGKGRWITIYANDGHVFMVVGGLRYDTSGAQGGSRWQLMNRSTRGFHVRHPVGL